MLAGMLVSMIRARMALHREIFTRKLTYNKVIHELECIYRFTLSTGKQIYSEISKKQQDIYEALDMPVPHSDQQVRAKVRKKRKNPQKKKG